MKVTIQIRPKGDPDVVSTSPVVILPDYNFIIESEGRGTKYLLKVVNSIMDKISRPILFTPKEK